MSAGRSCRAAVERVGAGRRGGDAVAGFDEVVRDERDDVRLVVDDEDALAGDGAAGRRSSVPAVRARLRAALDVGDDHVDRRSALWPPRGTITSA